MTGRIILNADDYALSPGVSQAIRMLAAAERITSTSAIVTRPGWMKDAAALQPLRHRIATGLHLNLTLGAPLGDAAQLARDGTMPGIAARITDAYARRLNLPSIAAEISRQLDAFESGMGTAPDFIDGHEHVHVLPGIRRTLLDILKSRYSDRPLLVRDPTPAKTILSQQSIKALTLHTLARNMRRDIERAGFVANDSFGGVTGFAATGAAVDRDFANAARLEGWRPLVMCHPGFSDHELVRIDTHSARRQLEFDALMTADNPLALNAWRPERATDGSIAWPYVKRETTA